MQGFSSRLEQIKFEQGVALIEAAIFLPVFILGIFFFVWMGVTINAKVSLEAGVSNATRYASTRGVKEVVGRSIIGDINDMVRAEYGGNGATPSASLLDLLIKDVPTADGLNYYDGTGDNQFGPVFERGFRDFPPEYIYTLVFLYDSLEMSIGEDIKYPCDPALTNPDGAGCVQCMFVHPDEMTWEPPDPNSMKKYVAKVGGAVLPPPRRKIALQCRYRPSNTLMSPIVSLINLITGGNATAGLLITKTALMENALM